ncbi:MAG: RluA family pseudouridine synthase, partial [Halioglobus sp.]|nr:RluA family pseudouridine synthase [Halioglobus sp.]
GRVKADYRVCAGDLVRIPPFRESDPGEPRPVPGRVREQLLERIVYEDDDLLVIDKPSGLAVHGGSGLSFGLIESLRQMRPEAGYLELVHRLDRDTSGLILVAKRAAALRDLHRQLRDKTVDKRYLALVGGSWPGDRQLVEAPLQKNVLRSGERMVNVSREGRHSVTEFSVVERFAEATLVEARPVTGRTHQIRVHARHVGCPLLGDDKYSDDDTRLYARSIGLRRLFLHASKLAFTARSGATLALEAPLDDELEKVLENIRNLLI